MDLDKFRQFLKASRASIVMVMLIPVALGALGAWVWDGVFNVWLFLLTLLGTGLAHLFSNMINDLWDYKNGADTGASEEVDAITSHSGYLTNGTWSVKGYTIVTWSLFGIAILSGVILSIFSGWWAFVLGLLGGMIAYFYVAPPLRLGYRGKGFSEIAILLSFGVLPVMGAYYVQTSHMDVRAFVLSLPIGLLTTLILFNHHFLHWKLDLQAGKKTLIVVWGEAKALRFSKVLLLLAVIALLVAVLVGSLPYYALIAWLVLIPLYRVYGKLKDHNPSRAYLPLMGGSVKGTYRFGFILIIIMIIQGLI
ncbi:prenyltransferase [Paenibacillus macquariensis]|uniref:1,4-dihydroxy-2-naphthoate octaprenyltransferase n=1 Tax=Paenibacillus macquariensis TaxID=948756 RepID=A0ABY1JRA5_9BACL|nr:prenyltransferase [Paenibacillus macquariensis]MEC0092724.1 prenyltransferase [Paenibacillus macquariensis]SIQ64747.1 1,4-dihydroxy-2-naphthoate octaprenyltransferase [Paenibacillus macquariensis]